MFIFGPSFLDLHVVIYGYTRSFLRYLEQIAATALSTFGCVCMNRDEEEFKFLLLFALFFLHIL